MTNKEAIEVLCDQIKGNKSEAMQMALKALYEPKWIPCSERLPDKADFYLTSSKSKQYPDDPYEVFTHISFYACGEWACTNRTVTAWMPLPESYRGDEDGQ